MGFSHRATRRANDCESSCILTRHINCSSSVENSAVRERPIAGFVCACVGVSTATADYRFNRLNVRGWILVRKNFPPITKRETTLDFRFVNLWMEHAHEGQIAIALGEIQAIADDEHIRNFKADVIR